MMYKLWTKLRYHYFLIIPAVVLAASPWWTMPLQANIPRYNLHYWLILLAAALLILDGVARKKAWYERYPLHPLLPAALTLLFAVFLVVTMPFWYFDFYSFRRLLFVLVCIYDVYAISERQTMQVGSVSPAIEAKIFQKKYPWLTDDREIWESQQKSSASLFRLGYGIILLAMLFFWDDWMVLFGSLGVLISVLAALKGRWVLTKPN